MTIIMFQRGITKNYRQELQFMCFARRLMMLCVSLKFHENILKGFQVTRLTRNDHFPFQGKILQNSRDKSYARRLMMLYISVNI